MADIDRIKLPNDETIYNIKDTTARGTANSAIQSVKINGTALTPDGNKAVDYAPVGSDMVLTGYQKSTTAGQDVAATDTVNQAIGKIEKRVGDNQTNISTIQQTIGDINTVLEGVL